MGGVRRRFVGPVVQCTAEGEWGRCTSASIRTYTKQAGQYGLCNRHYRERAENGEYGPRRIRARGSLSDRDSEGRKQCKRCQNWLAESEFPTDNKMADKLFIYCRICHNSHRYGIDRNRYLILWTEQKGECAVCTSSLTEPYIDHDHACCPQKRNCCGECVRGLLCQNCNTAAGLLRDNPQTAESMAVYLRERNIS